MSDPALTPQEPGALASVDDAKLAELAELTIPDLVEELPALTDDELAQLLAIEQTGKNRGGAITAMEREQAHREADRAVPADGKVDPPAPIGDARSYANMPSSEVDPKAIQGRVLANDGWVLPAPSANPEG